MKSLISRLAAFTPVTAGLGGIGVGVASANGTPAFEIEPMACTEFANKPYKSGTNVKGSAGRSGCSTKVSSIDVKLYRQRIGPDDKLDSGSATNIANQSWTMTGAGWASYKYYTYLTSSSGAVIQSQYYTY